ncbi:PAS domain-containing protein [Kiloniella majae]|uniref:PAS domain-containing protein n=1 Tax=Kiloniella majae TaxID=1938558 RepID=UPI000A27823B|nr:PAS domain-containing protein [Kiloniella majae]
MFISAQSDLSELKEYPRLLESWYWYSSLCEKLGHLPSRQDINPLDIKFALGYEMLVENDRQNKNPRVRLVGIVAEEFMGLPVSATGKTYDTFLTDESRVAACGKLTEALDEGKPLFGTTTYVRKDGRTLGYARLICPLHSQNNEPEMVFIIFQAFTENEDRETGAKKEEAMKRWL